MTSNSTAACRQRCKYANNQESKDAHFLECHNNEQHGWEVLAKLVVGFGLNVLPNLKARESMLQFSCYFSENKFSGIFRFKQRLVQTEEVESVTQL